MLELNKIYFEDCLKGMQQISDQSINMILCDLPYGSTSCKWDIIIPFKDLWKQYNRIIKENGTVALFGSQPFSSFAIQSNLKMFKYEIIWEKGKGAGFFHANYQPLKAHENILIFSKGNSTYSINGNFMTYNPQMTNGKSIIRPVKGKKLVGMLAEKAPNSIVKSSKNYDGSKRFPISVIKFSQDFEKLHPTQKPILLCEWLIKTYSNEDELILDNCMGSGTTAIASMNTKRNFIGFENDPKYYEIGVKRIEKWQMEFLLGEQKCLYQ